ncbi:MAG: tetratricopeptide repeat protein [Treponema sp.]|uniref:tetratricopeptide repeat protein n=1 Tax=Treponema sp. TaxID=166 RepID=UPI00298E871E|nr:tetratricopeptide repeat protein [Treponema sp.]MCQ2600133.1 tetratricopeptide repeat protein [Treponema sp.]
MELILPIAIAAVAILVVASVLLLVMSKKRATGKSGGPRQKNRATIIRECTNKLAHNPQNVQALEPLAELYYSEHLWDKALPLYENLLGLSARHPEINIGETNLRVGVCMVKLGKAQESLNFLLTALKAQPELYETNFYLGQALFKTGDYEKAIPLLKKALTINPETQGINQPIGMACYKGHKFKEAVQFLRRALDENPEDKEALFALADSMQECGFGDKALKIFTHLRPDPKFGAQSSLSAGIIHTRMQQLDKAAQDFEIGLKLPDIPQELYLELNYRLAACYFRLNKIAVGLDCLNKIQQVVPVYKDVNQLIARYKELNSNSNLQLYLTSGTSDFVALCRNLVKIFHKNSFVKIVDVAVITDSIEILCEVENAKWEDKELFRFYRNSGSIGELYIRDFHAKIRDTKCDKGYCITSGSFSEEARKFIDGRPIDLIEKAQLMKFLKLVT